MQFTGRDENGFSFAFDVITRKQAKNVKDIITHALCLIAGEFPEDTKFSTSEFMNKPYMEGLLKKEELTTFEQYIISLLKYIYNTLDFDPQIGLVEDEILKVSSRESLLMCLNLPIVDKLALSLRVSTFQVKYEDLVNQPLADKLKHQPVVSNAYPSQSALTLFGAGFGVGAAIAAAVGVGLSLASRK
jgi:hypothetical protein